MSSQEKIAPVSHCMACGSKMLVIHSNDIPRAPSEREKAREAVIEAAKKELEPCYKDHERIEKWNTRDDGPPQGPCTCPNCRAYRALGDA